MTTGTASSRVDFDIYLALKSALDLPTRIALGWVYLVAAANVTALLCFGAFIFVSSVAMPVSIFSLQILNIFPSGTPYSYTSAEVLSSLQWTILAFPAILFGFISSAIFLFATSLVSKQVFEQRFFAIIILFLIIFTWCLAYIVLNDTLPADRPDRILDGKFANDVTFLFLLAWSILLIFQLFASIGLRFTTYRPLWYAPSYSLPVTAARYGLVDFKSLATIVRAFLRLLRSLAFRAGLAGLVTFALFIVPLLAVLIGDVTVTDMRVLLWIVIAAPVAAAAWFAVETFRRPGVRWFNVLASVLFALVAFDAYQLYDSKGWIIDPFAGRSENDQATHYLFFVPMVSIGSIFRPWLLAPFRKFYGLLREDIAADAVRMGAKSRLPGALYLRSFEDDETSVPTYWRMLPWVFGSTSTQVRLETVMSEVVCAAAPLVALHSERSSGAGGGAAQYRTHSDNWKERVEELIQESRFIVALLGQTENFAWEVSRIAELGLTSKLIILFPPQRDAMADLAAIAPDLCDQFAAETGSTRNIRAMAYDPRRETHVLLTSRFSNAIAYAEILRMALGLQLSRKT